MKMGSDVHQRVGTPHMKMYLNVHHRMGTPHMKMCSDVLTGWWVAVKIQNHATS